jgi:hypothetical protein
MKYINIINRSLLCGFRLSSPIAGATEATPDGADVNDLTAAAQQQSLMEASSIRRLKGI